jgi:anaerobic selenocysteine-containing dehydrogenase
VASRNLLHVCTLCEAACGLRFEVEGDRIASVRGDPDDVHSRGYSCPKGIAIAEVHHDPDRLRQPVRRTAAGEFEPIGWEEAFALATARLREIRRRHGRDAVALYMGNPVVHNHGALLLRAAFAQALGTRNRYSAGSQDTSPRFAASYHLYGNSFAIPVPDVDRTDHLLCLGANPLVSNGSVLSAPNLRARLRALRERGGRLVVVDPRRTETAREADEWVPIRPGTDAALLLAMVGVLVERGLADRAALARHTRGFEDLEPRLARIRREDVARHTGVSEPTIVRLAEEFARARSSAAYSRVGVCNGRHGTLGSWATDLLNAAAGRLGAVGGALFASPAIDPARVLRLPGMDGHARWRSRVRGLPETLGDLPAACLAEEIETPGDGQVRALVTWAGNPVLSTPNGRRLASALGRLEFMLAIDLYVNETTRHADLILPPAWALADDHVDVIFPALAVRNTLRYSPPVVARVPGERHDWEILLELAARLGGGPTGTPALDAPWRWLRRAGLRYSPTRVAEWLLRSGIRGDRFGLRRGVRGFAQLARDHPHGLDFGPLEPGVARRVFHADRRVRLDAPPLVAALDALVQELPYAREPDGLLLVGRREVRTNNSWMHNAPSLVSGRERCVLLVHPKDAEASGVHDGEEAVLESRVHRGAVQVKVSDEMRPGIVSLPHGWGHRESARWQRVAGRRPGVSVNDWTDDQRVEAVVGQSVLNGVPVRLLRAEPEALAAGAG